MFSGQVSLWFGDYSLNESVNVVSKQVAGYNLELNLCLFAHFARDFPVRLRDTNKRWIILYFFSELADSAVKRAK